MGFTGSLKSRGFGVFGQSFSHTHAYVLLCFSISATVSALSAVAEYVIGFVTAQ